MQSSKLIKVLLFLYLISLFFSLPWIICPEMAIRALKSFPYYFCKEGAIYASDACCLWFSSISIMVFCLSGSAAQTRTGTSAWCSPYLVLPSFAVLPHLLVLWNGPIGRQSLSFPLGRCGGGFCCYCILCVQYSLWAHIRYPSAEKRELFSFTKTCPSYVLCLWETGNFCFELLLPLSRAFAVLQCKNLLLTFNQSLCPFLPVLLAFNLCTISSFVGLRCRAVSCRKFFNVYLVVTSVLPYAIDIPQYQKERPVLRCYYAVNDNHFPLIYTCMCVCVCVI